MNKRDLLQMFRRELEEVRLLNALEDEEAALKAVLNEVYASLHLFGCKKKYAIPKDLDLEVFRGYYSKTVITH